MTLREAYARFLPTDLRPPAGTEPQHDWFPWRGDAIHVERFGDPDAPVRVMLLHGAGGHAGAMWPFAALCAAAGARVTVPDLPGYGLTQVRRPGAVRYPDWIELVTDLVHAEHDDRPLLLTGASMGGLLAAEVAARTGRADTVLATCLLDPSDPQVRRAVARAPWLGQIALPALQVSAGPFAALRIPVRWLADMAAMSNEPDLVQLVLRDERGGGSWVPLGFLRSYLGHVPEVPPEHWPAVPTVLAHPLADGWTPIELSSRFLDRLAGPTRVVPLEGAGHFPVEEPGVRQLAEVITELVGDLARA